jgi:hypothetical protein
VKALTRIRIIVFAIMVFGAFANFGQNEWGNIIIYVCQLLLALSFFGEMIYYYALRIKRKELPFFNKFSLALFALLIIFPIIASILQLRGEIVGNTLALTALLTFFSQLADIFISYFRKKMGYIILPRCLKTLFFSCASSHWFSGICIIRAPTY